MNIRPILFSTEMVQSILDGRKTQTRRVVRCKNDTNNLALHSDIAARRFIEDSNEVKKLGIDVGDILWVRETWNNIPVYPDGRMCIGGMYYYKADGDIRPVGWRGNWRPSIHMPREAARIFLRVTDVRVERLQDIDSAGAIAEGCDGRGDRPSSGTDGTLSIVPFDFSVERFQTVWDETVPRNPCKFKRNPWYWKDNPWVWVITFERCEKPDRWLKER